MADYQHIHTHSVQARGESKNGSGTVTAKGENCLRPTVATGQTAFVVVVAFAVAKLKSLFWKSDQDVTITPYNDATPGDPITIPAGGYLAWYYGCGWDCPLAADVTSLKVANSSGSLATLDLIHLIDPT